MSGFIVCLGSMIEEYFASYPMHNSDLVVGPDRGKIARRE